MGVMTSKTQKPQEQMGKLESGSRLMASGSHRREKGKGQSQKRHKGQAGKTLKGMGMGAIDPKSQRKAPKTHPFWALGWLKAAFWLGLGLAWGAGRCLGVLWLG